MLLQTNSYIVPKDKRAEHARVIRRFRQVLRRLGCDHFEVYEQVGANWSNTESGGRYVQILRFVDRKHQLSVQSAERVDPTAQQVIADFCDLINFPYQQQQGLFAVGFYTSVLPVAPKRGTRGELISTVEHEVMDEEAADTAADTDPADVGVAAGMATGVAAEAVFADEPVGQSVNEVVESAEQISADETPLEEFELPHDALEEHSTGGHTLEDLAGVQPPLESAHPMIESYDVGTGLEGEIDQDDAEPHMPVAEEDESPDPFMRIAGGEDDVLEEALESHGFVEGELIEEEPVAHDKPHSEPR